MTLEDVPRTGLEYLADALASPLVRAQPLSVFEAVGLAADRFARSFHVHLRGLPLASHVLASEGAHLAAYPQTTAADVFLNMQRALPSCRETLTGIARGQASPLRRGERPTLTRAILRPLTSAGYVIDESRATALTNAAAQCFADALAAPVAAPGRPVRLGGESVSAGPVLDHDFYHWQTGEPKYPDACMRAIEALLTVQDALLEAPAETELVAA